MRLSEAMASRVPHPPKKMPSFGVKNFIGRRNTRPILDNMQKVSPLFFPIIYLILVFFLQLIREEGGSGFAVDLQQSFIIDNLHKVEFFQ